MNVHVMQDENGKPERVYAQVVLSDATVAYDITDMLNTAYENVKREAEGKLGASPSLAGRVAIIYEATR